MAVIIAGADMLFENRLNIAPALFEALHALLRQSDFHKCPAHAPIAAVVGTTNAALKMRLRKGLRII